MSSDDAPAPDQVAQWIIEARDGSAEALGQLMAFSRQYLLLIARAEMPEDLQAKAGASDLVQETQCEAVQDFTAFRGHSSGELLGWLRQILLHNIHDFTRRFGTSVKRAAGREVPLNTDDSAADAAEQLVADLSSVSSELNRQEEATAMAQALTRLPEDYRQVICWHHQENVSFAEIARRLNRSEGAVRKLWSRAIQQLQQHLKSPPGST